MSFFSIELFDLEYFLLKHNIDKNDICLVGSASLSHIGIRKNNDIDIIIKKSTRDLIFNSNKTIHLSKKTQIVQSPWSSLFSDDDIIFNKNLHFFTDINFKVVRPELLYHKKSVMRRKKDVNDINELIEYSQFSPNWNKDLLNNFINKQNLIKKIINKFYFKYKYLTSSFISIKKFKKNNIYSLPTNVILSKQYVENDFNRFDIIVRYLVIVSYMQSNNEYFDLYIRMQNIRGNSNYQNPLNNYINLINKINKHGFDLNYPIIVNENLELVDGAHRLAAALYFNCNIIKIKIVSDKNQYLFGKNWFQDNGFLKKEIRQLNFYKNKIFQKNHMFFEIILWPPVADLFSQIESDISSQYKVISSMTYTDIKNFDLFVKSIYQIDDIKDWKVKLKLDAMKKYDPTVRRISIYIKKPDFRYKQSNGKLISTKIELLKREIRNKYSKIILNYFHDIIIHISDNFEHNFHISKLFKDV